jgi:hypothetical protein
MYLSYYFTLNFLWYVWFWLSHHHEHTIKGIIHNIWVYIVIRGCNLCFPPSTRYCGTRHRLASSTLILLWIIKALIIIKLKSNELVFDSFYKIFRCIQKNFIVFTFDHPWIVVNPYYEGVTPVTVEYQANTLLKFNNL